MRKIPTFHLLTIFLLTILTVIVTRPSLSESNLKMGQIDSSVIAPGIQLGKAFATIADHSKPAVVSVFSEKLVKYQSNKFPLPFNEDFLRQLFGDQAPDLQSQQFKSREYNVPVRGMGSGLILDTSGHVLTNYHVVNDATKVRVQLADRSTFTAKIIQVDPKTDIAIIQLIGNYPKDLPTIALGNSDLLQAGELVLAVGAPFGLPQTVTHGIISATGRSNLGIEDYEDFIQTDTPINPGNSGGPLINMNGEVVGINTAIASAGLGQNSGVSFSVPSNLIKVMLPKLLKGERIARGQLGVLIQDLNEQLAKQFELKENSGVLVAQVHEGMPAQKAGVRSGDVITVYNGKNVTAATELRNLVSATAPGSEIKIKLLRNKKEINLIAKITQESVEKKVLPAPPVKEDEKQEDNLVDQIGIAIRDIDNLMAKALKIKNGVFIDDVQDGSAAAISGIQPNDVIVEANHQSIKNIKEFLKVLEEAKNKDALLLLIKRQNASVYVVVPTQ